MHRLRVAALLVVLVVSLAVAALTPLKALPSLGQHQVRPGESLYCIGRGYGVAPWAIAQANGLAVLAHVFVGQVLTIPAVTWTNIPPGPVCAPQFAPAGLATLPASPVACLTQVYIIQRGDTLWRIGLQYGVTVAALQAANNLQSSLIFVAQPLIIPSNCALPVPTATPTLAAPGGSSGSTGDPAGPTATLAPPTATSPAGPSSTATTTNTVGPSPTASSTNTAGPSPTASATPTVTNTPTLTNTPTATSTASPTNTPVPPSETPPGTAYPS